MKKRLVQKKKKKPFMEPRMDKEQYLASFALSVTAVVVVAAAVGAVVAN